jgi:hypothetical protein
MDSFGPVNEMRGNLLHFSEAPKIFCKNIEIPRVLCEKYANTVASIGVIRLFIFANITLSIVDYNCPMLKVDWLAAGVLLIPSSVGLVIDKYMLT